MKVILTPVNAAGDTNKKILEFNTNLPELACKALPVSSTVAVTERYSVPVAIDGSATANAVLTKLNIQHTVNYTNTLGLNKSFTTRHSDIILRRNTNPLTYNVTKAVDTLVPENGVVDNSSANSGTPNDSNKVPTKCHYSVFILEPTEPAAPTN